MQVFFLELMNTIAIISQNGGAGKTTVALHLAVSSTRAGRNTAIIDLDPQASAARPRSLSSSRLTPADSPRRLPVCDKPRVTCSTWTRRLMTTTPH